MLAEGMIADSRVDRHGSRIPPKDLTKLAEEINESKTALPFSINHDICVMPIGKVLSAKIVYSSDGEVEIHTNNEIFFEDIKELVFANEKYYISSSTIDSRPFLTMHVNSDKTIFEVDPANYEEKDLQELSQYAAECNCAMQMNIRKALYSEPIIIFFVGTLLYKIANKTTDKLADKIADDISSLYDTIKKLINKGIEKLRSDHLKITYLISDKMDTCNIQLVIISESPDDVFLALNKNTMQQLISKIADIREKFPKSMMLQFIFDIKCKKWDFNYLATTDGEAIGSEKCYKHTKQLYIDNFSGKTNWNVSIEGMAKI